VVELLPLAIIVAYMGTVLGVGLAAWRKYPPSSLDAWVHGHGFAGTIVQTLLIAGTQYSALMFMGMVGYTYLLGVTWLVTSPAYFLVTCVPFMLLFYPKMWRISKKLGTVTIGQMASLLYGRSVGVFVGLLTAVALLPYMQVQLVAAGYVCEIGSYGLLPYWVGAAAIYIITAIYVFLGGIRSVAWTNVVQGIMLLAFVFIVPFASTFLTGFGGFAEVMKRVAEMYPKQIVLPGLFAPWGPIYQVTYTIMWLGWFFHPSIFTRAATVRDTATIRKTCALFTFTWIGSMLNMICAGALIMLAYPGQAPIADKLWIKFVGDYYPPVMLGVLGACALAALASSLNSQAQALASEVHIDVFNVLAPGKVSSRTQLIVARTLSVIFLVLGFVLALVAPLYLVVLAEFTCAISVQALPAFLGVMYGIRFFNKYAIAAGVAGGLLASMLTSKYFFPIPYLWFGFVGLVVNFAIVLVVSLLTKKGRPSEEVIKTIKEMPNY
jgi:SSS family solute:Na+ symporter